MGTNLNANPDPKLFITELFDLLITRGLSSSSSSSGFLVISAVAPLDVSVAVNCGKDTKKEGMVCVAEKYVGRNK